MRDLLFRLQKDFTTNNSTYLYILEIGVYTPRIPVTNTQDTKSSRISTLLDGNTFL